ncbi:hypothetical protein [Pseudothermotoga sp.]|uniref:hypothetical protein n=1 Tax=Pseudothermotoga sp. TaxID=2033661 RepID=UPI0031F64638
MKKFVAVCLWLSLGVAVSYLLSLGPNWLELLVLPEHFVTALSTLCHGFSTAVAVAIFLPNLSYLALRSFDPKLLPLFMLELILLSLFLSLFTKRKGLRRSIFFSFVLSWTTLRFVEHIFTFTLEWRKLFLFSVALVLNIVLLPEVKKLLVKSSEPERR